jgi:hypothetical protein
MFAGLTVIESVGFEAMGDFFVVLRSWVAGLTST